MSCPGFGRRWLLGKTVARLLPIHLSTVTRMQLWETGAPVLPIDAVCTVTSILQWVILVDVRAESAKNSKH